MEISCAGNVTHLACLLPTVFVRVPLFHRSENTVHGECFFITSPLASPSPVFLVKSYIPQHSNLSSLGEKNLYFN